MAPPAFVRRCARRLPLALAATLLSGCTLSMTVDRPSHGVSPAASAGTTPKSTPDAKQPSASSSPYLPESMFSDAATAPGTTKAPVVNVFGEFAKVRPKAAAVDLGLRQHTFNDKGYDADVAVDPAGKWIVYTTSRDGEHTQIYVQRVDGTGEPKPLTQSFGDDAQPNFSPDGKRIAFASNRTGTWQIFVMNADGTNVIQVTQGECNAMHPSFSPGGDRLVYSSLPAGAAAAGGQWELWTVDLSTRVQQMVGYGLFPTWSPRHDRDVIAFQRTRARGSRWFSLWTCELQQGQATQITEVAVSANSALVSPSWSPDGTSLAFATIVEPAQTRGGKPQGQQDVWVMTLDGANRRRLTDGTATNLTPHWAVDNRVYFVSDRSGHECVWSLPATAPVKPVTDVANTDPSEVRP